MAVRNVEESELLVNPLAPRICYEADELIKENCFIGDECDSNEEHVGLRYEENGKCVECHFVENYDIPLLCALSTFLVPDLAPQNFTQFLGKFDPVSDDDEVFFGKGCERCGNNLRYRADRRCVFCVGVKLVSSDGPAAMSAFAANVSHQPMTSMYDRFRRTVANHEGQSKYEGLPCKSDHKHGGTRYSKNGRCVGCAADHKQAQLGKKKPATAHTEAGSEFDGLFD